MRTARAMTKVEFWQTFWPWLAIYGVVLFCLIGYTLTLNARTLKRDAVHKAQVDRCLASRPVLRKFSRHVQGVNALAKILVVNSAAVLEGTAKNDPQYPVRLANLKRIILARAEVTQLPGFPVPSIDQCESRS